MRAERFTLSLLLGVALQALSPQHAAGQFQRPDAKGPDLTTTGSGEVTLSPQRATVRVGVSTHAASAAEASTQNATVLRNVLDTLVRAGFRLDSLQTVVFGVGPNYDNANGRKLIDYVARAAIRVSLSDLSRIGRVIDMALAAGATEIGGIEFQSDSTDIARHRALAQAFGKAHDDARAVAAAAGGRLGRLLEVTTRDEDYGGFAMDFEASAPAFMQTAILPRDVTVRVSVQARWEFLAARQ